MPRPVQRLILSLVLSAVALPTLWGQSVNEPFDDGNLLSAPAWVGTTSGFVHEAGVLRLEAPDSSGTAWLSTPFSRNLALNATEWQLWLRLDCLLRAGRRVRWVLSSNAADLTQPFAGYVVEFGRVGGEGRVELFRWVVGQPPVRLLASAAGRTDAFATLRLRVRRSAGVTATWELALDPTGGRDFAVEATQLETGLLTSAHTGVVMDYTASARQHFSIDDVVAGTPPADVLGPRVVSVEALSATELRATFDEPVAAMPAASVFALAGIGTAQSAARELVNRAAVRLTFASPLPVGEARQLSVTNLPDLAGNPGSSSAPVTWWDAAPPTRGSLIVAEVMPDPTPPIGLPESEYIELYNRGSRAADLTGCTVADATGERLPLPRVVVPPGQWLLLVPTPRRAAFGPGARGVPMSTPWLNDDADSVVLRRADGQLISAAHYRTDRGPVEGRAGSGRSLERTDLATPCDDPALWQPSRDPSGGTPGAPNSLNIPLADATPPRVTTWSAPGPSQVLLSFDGPLDSASAATPANYRLSYPSGMTLTPLLATLVGASRVELLLPAPLDSQRVTTLVIRDVADCPGNVLSQAIELQLLRLRAPRPGELILNELLAHPAVSGSRYVELRSTAAVGIDAAGCRLLRARGSVELELDSAEALPLVPGAVRALTADAADVVTRFTPPFDAAISQTAELPAIGDDGDVLSLLSPTGALLDLLDYRPALHSRLLNYLRGVALERVDATRWQSAAGPRYGTPGYVNSRAEQAGLGLGIRLERETFSPDGDGRDDVLTVVLEGAPADALLTLDVADVQGRLRRSLVRRLLMPTVGQLTWDGRDDQGALLAPGIYILIGRVSTGGAEQLVRLPCVLARRP